MPVEDLAITRRPRNLRRSPFDDSIGGSMHPQAARRSRLWLVAIILLCGLAGFALVRWWGHVDVMPAPPTGLQAPMQLPATTSHFSIVLDFPVKAIEAQLNAIPKSFHFDSGGNPRVYGNPSRGPITVSIDAAAKRVQASMPAQGRVQAEAQFLARWSVGIDVSADFAGSFSPNVTPDWVVNPQLQLSAHANHAVARTRLPLVGDVDVTGRAQDAVNKALPNIKKSLEEKVIATLNLRDNATKVWNQINSVHRLTDQPPIWLGMTPRKVSFEQPSYATGSIEMGLALDLDTRIFIQDAAPDVHKSTLPNLSTRSLSNDCTLSIPVEISYKAINDQLKAKLSENTLRLPDGASVNISNATVEPYGDRLLLTVDFSGNGGWLRSASGRLYIVGVPVFDAAKAELHVENLDYTAATKNILVQSVEWLAHAKLLEAMKTMSSASLAGELSRAKSKANDELERLKSQLPKEIDARLLVADIQMDRLAFATERVFVVFTVKGKMSATLKP
jgi:hypothetical protein